MNKPSNGAKIARKPIKSLDDEENLNEARSAKLLSSNVIAAIPLTVNNPPLVWPDRQTSQADLNRSTMGWQPLPRGKLITSQANYWRVNMRKGWTPERRARQAVLIQNWRPWEKSTGQKTPEGKEAVSRNTDQGQIRPLLRWMRRTLREQEKVRRDFE